MVQTLQKYVVPVIGFALLAYALFSAVREGSKLYQWKNHYTIYSEYECKDDGLMRFTSVVSEDFVSAGVPLVGDTILTIDDSVATAERAKIVFCDTMDHSETTQMSINQHGYHWRVVMRSTTPTYSSFLRVALAKVLHDLLAISFIGIALWIIRKYWSSATAQVLALYCLSIASISLAGLVATGYSPYMFDILGNEEIRVLPRLFLVFIGAFWLHLQLLFPRPKLLMLKLPWLGYLICYSVPLMATLIYFGIPLIDRVDTNGTDVVLAAAVLQLLAGFVILFFGVMRSKDRLERRQSKLVLSGSVVGVLAIAVLIFVSLDFRAIFVLIDPISSACLALACVLVSPISFVYAFGKHRLLEVEARVKRVTLYVIVTAVLYVISLLLTYSFIRPLFDLLVTRIGIPAFAVTMLLIFLSLGNQSEIRYILERVFFPGRFRLRVNIHKLSVRILSLKDRVKFWNLLENDLRAELAVTSVTPLFRTEGDGGFRFRSDGNTPFYADQGLIRYFACDHRPLLLDEAIASGRTGITAAETEWLQERQVALLLPLITGNQVVGVLGFGYKVDQRDYSRVDLHILSTLAPEVALASENIR
jgi:GAF domain-containing protein